MKEYHWGGGKIIETFVPQDKEWIPSLITNFEDHRGKLTFSHKINHRWENAYLPIDLVPDARIPIRYARDLGTEKFSRKMCIIYDGLKGSGSTHPPFWFNLAQSNEATGLHDHALLSALSGVVYLQCEKNAGNLYFHQDGEADLEIEPECGKLVLFEPWMKHGVRPNRSNSIRFSMAFNLLPFPLPSNRF